MEQNINLPATYQAEPEYHAPVPAPATSLFTDMAAFEAAQRVCKMLAASSLVPTTFQNNIPNAMIALEMANRTGFSPFMVMQNLYVVHGRPAFSAQFVIAAINACGRFSPLHYDMEGEGDDRSCRAWAIEKATGERLDGPAVSVKMAKADGWYDKNGSKWKTMPEVMLGYRAATFFGRRYAPDILMGMRTDDELDDIGELPQPRSARQPPRGGGPEAATETVPASGAAAINALLEGDAPTTCHSERSEESPAEIERLRQAAGDASSPAAPQHDSREQDDAAPPEYRAMMRYIEEINGIDDPEALKSWWQGRDYKLLVDELGGMNSEWHRAVAEHVQGRIRELEAGA